MIYTASYKIVFYDALHFYGHAHHCHQLQLSYKWSKKDLPNYIATESMSCHYFYVTSAQTHTQV